MVARVMMFRSRKATGSVFQKGSQPQSLACRVWPKKRNPTRGGWLPEPATNDHPDPGNRANPWSATGFFSWAAMLQRFWGEAGSSVGTVRRRIIATTATVHILTRREAAVHSPSERPDKIVAGGTGRDYSTGDCAGDSTGDSAVGTGLSGLIYVWDGVRQLSAHPASSAAPTQK